MTIRSALILLIEDDGDIRESIKEVLEDDGYQVLEAADGLEALEVLTAASALPQLILLDLMMPRMNGVQFREEIAKSPAWDRIPVVVLSADAEMRGKAQGLTVAASLAKPVELRVLFETVERVLAAS